MWTHLLLHLFHGGQPDGKDDFLQVDVRGGGAWSNLHFHKRSIFAMCDLFEHVKYILYTCKVFVWTTAEIHTHQVGVPDMDFETPKFPCGAIIFFWLAV